MSKRIKSIETKSCPNCGEEKLLKYFNSKKLDYDDELWENFCNYCKHRKRKFFRYNRRKDRIFPDDLEKECLQCKISKPLKDFYKNPDGKLGRTHFCKPCYKTISLRDYHGIDINFYNILFESQNGCCNICGKHQSELRVALCVDHDHKNGKIRGLLCEQCNFGLGNFCDNETFLVRAILYLHEFDNS